MISSLLPSLGGREGPGKEGHMHGGVGSKKASYSPKNPPPNRTSREDYGAHRHGRMISNPNRGIYDVVVVVVISGPESTEPNSNPKPLSPPLPPRLLVIGHHRSFIINLPPKYPPPRQGPRTPGGPDPGPPHRRPPTALEKGECFRIMMRRIKY